MLKFEEAFRRVLGKSFVSNQEEKTLIEEGLGVSYGSDHLKKALLKKFKNQILEIEDIPLFQSKLEYKFGKPNTLTALFKSSFEELNELKVIARAYGYSIVQSSEVSGSKMHQLEPKYPILLEKNMLEGCRLFHVTTLKKKEKILKYGLLPKDSQTTFEHSGSRVYIFFTKQPEIVISGLKKSLAENKFQKIQSDPKASEEDKKEPPKMVCLEIDKTLLDLHNVYLDESFDYKPNYFYAGFVMSGIDPKFIKEVDFRS
jgi:hypothetical protein